MITKKEALENHSNYVKYLKQLYKAKGGINV